MHLSNQGEDDGGGGDQRGEALPVTDATILDAAGLAFLLLGGLLYLIARRRLLLGRADAGRGLELRACLLVAVLALGGFALADLGMNFSWTGRLLLTDLDWLRFGLIFAGLLLLAHLLLRLQRSRADQVVLPIAAFLALLGLLNTYVWETRDANAYVSTAALPAVRAYDAELAKDASLSERTRATLRASLGPIPNELAYERHPGRFATVLDRDWRDAYNTTAERFRSLRSVSHGPTVAASVARVRLHERLKTQLFAVGLGLLLVPLLLFLVARPRLLMIATRRVSIVVPSACVLGLLGASLLTSGDRRLPALLELGGHRVTIFEPLKFGLVVVLALALARLRSNDTAGRASVLFALASAAVTVAAMAWRDTGAGIALLSVALVMTALVLGRRARVAIVLAGAAVLAIAPAAVRTRHVDVPQTIRVRLTMWTDPWGFYERAQIQNDVAGVLRRVLEHAERRSVSAKEELTGRSLSANRRFEAGSLVRDVEAIAQELQWRLDERQTGESRLGPLVPRANSSDELLLLEAEKLWSDLGGFQAASPAELGALHARVAKAIDRLRSQAARLEVALLLRKDGRLAAALKRPRPPPREVSVVAPDNFQLQRSLFALRAGGVFGVGLGRGRPESVPGLTEDVDSVALGESMGLAGIVLVALLIALLAGRGVELARGRRTDTFALLATGLGALLGLQALIRLGGVSGLLPFTGLTFPFLSRSGTGLVASFLIVAFLMVIGTRSPARPPRRVDGWSARLFSGGGFAAAFVLVVAPIALLQLTGRTLTSGHLLAGLPGTSAPFLHARNQWDGMNYRTAPGSIEDRRGTVLARTGSLGGARKYPDAELATELGHTLLQLDSSFRSRLRSPGRSAAGVGPTLVTTLDSRVERAAVDAFEQGSLEAGISEPRTLRGAVVVLDARTGDILALASRPTFSLDELTDPVAWAAAEARERRASFPYRYLNRAVHGFYPPGSIFKTVTAAGVLERGFHTLHSRDFDYRHGPESRRPPDGADQLGPWHQLLLPDGQPITDGNHPQLDVWNFTLEEAFAWSCNVAFAQMGLELGPADVVGFARRFGFERPIDVPGLGSTTSTIDNHPERRIGARYVARTKSNLARTAFGQGQARVTPLQMALVAAAIANRGKIMQPHIVGGWRAPGGRWLEQERPRVFQDTQLSKLTIADLRELMRTSVTHGWAGTARVNPNNARPGVGGKTGSAEWSETRDASHAWFIGYYPAEEPRIALAVVIERGGSGPTVAGRIAQRIFASKALAEYVRARSGR